MPKRQPPAGNKPPAKSDPARSIRLTIPGLVIELSALTPRLFRLRGVAGRRLPVKQSWAVDRTDWPAHPVKCRHTASEASVTTSAGRLTFQLRSGAWRLEGPNGRTIFSSAAHETRFAGAEAQVVLNLADGDAIFGLGETTGTYNKRGLIREFWNTDILGHAPAIHPGMRSLYVSVPFGILLGTDRVGGIFWDNPGRQTWDLGQTKPDRWRLQAATGDIDLYLFLGNTVAEVVHQFTGLTGHMPLPPRWALGYHQCRYSYKTRRRVEEIARTFRRKKIPCDAVYLDIHHMDGYRVFTFGKTFPQPARMMRKLARQGFKVVAIVDPGVKDDPTFGVLRRGKGLNAFVKDRTGRKDFLGRVWPGRARFPDFLNARVREWWEREQRRLFRLGVEGIWNDMNEPANFALPTKTLDERALHATDFGRARHGEVHNLYGMQMARASRAGALRARPDRRPFIITRAGYAGVQRHALVWTGDNSSVWTHLEDSMQMYLNLGLSGVPFCGGDVGGFVGNTTPELLVRWLQMATFIPFLRNHTNLDTIDQEPWAFGPRVEEICRHFIELRYRLLPYLYCLFAEARRSGTPIMRPLFWHYQHDTNAVPIGDQFLLGPDLLVAPVHQQGATVRSVYLPAGFWYDFRSAELIKGGQYVVARAPLDQIPLYVRAGALIPLGEVVQHTGELDPRTVELHHWVGGAGSLDWYEDDGETNDYEHGGFLRRALHVQSSNRRGTLRMGSVEGTHRPTARTWKMVIHGLKRRPGLRREARPLKVIKAGSTYITSWPDSPTPLALGW